ncbi:MAG: hypothetical protein MI673_00590 [Thiotrichales bacterium]|nr:hypothetical protein [Thiotrichales bacterium]
MANGEGQDGVAVGGDGEVVVHRGRAATAALVHHHHVLLQLATRTQHHHPRRDVGAASGSGVGHDLDGLAGVILCDGRNSQQGDCRGRENDPE